MQTMKLITIPVEDFNHTSTGNYFEKLRVQLATRGGKKMSKIQIFHFWLLAASCSFGALINGLSTMQILTKIKTIAQN